MVCALHGIRWRDVPDRNGERRCRSWKLRSSSTCFCSRWSRGSSGARGSVSAVRFPRSPRRRSWGSDGP